MSLNRLALLEQEVSLGTTLYVVIFVCPCVINFPRGYDNHLNKFKLVYFLGAKQIQQKLQQTLLFELDSSSVRWDNFNDIVVFFKLRFNRFEYM